MTSRQLWNKLLIEQNKVSAPTMLLEDFNHTANKAIYQVINKRYNIYDVNQQTTDDLRVLKTTTILPVESAYGDAPNWCEEDMLQALVGASHEINLPPDYFHLLNCICLFEVVKPKKGVCVKTGKYLTVPARRLTADMEPSIIDNAYFKPSYDNPYFYINYISPYEVTPTKSEPESSGEIIVLGRDMNVRAGSPETTPDGARIEIKCGQSDYFNLVGVRIDYIRKPKTFFLTQEQIDLTEDTSDLLEFPDYICYEILKELVTLVLENSSDPRLQTYNQVTQSIAPPAQQMIQTKK